MLSTSITISSEQIKHYHIQYNGRILIEANIHVSLFVICLRCLLHVNNDDF